MGNSPLHVTYTWLYDCHRNPGYFFKYRCFSRQRCIPIRYVICSLKYEFFLSALLNSQLMQGRRDRSGRSGPTFCKAKKIILTLGSSGRSYITCSGLVYIYTCLSAQRRLTWLPLSPLRILAGFRRSFTLELRLFVRSVRLDPEQTS